MKIVGRKKLNPLTRHGRITGPRRRTPRRQAGALILIAASELLLSVGCSSAGSSASGAPLPGGDTRREPVVRDASAQATIRQRAVDLLRKEAIGPDSLLRANAIEGLQPRPELAEPLVRAGLHDENLAVRFVAAMTVGKLKLKDSVVFAESLLHDESRIIQAAAMYAIRQNGGSADPTLLARMLESSNTTERAQAAYILGELDDPSAIALLRSAARRSFPLSSPIEDRLVRLQIAEALVKLGDLDAIETIRASLYPSRPEDLEATALAVQIIGNVNDRRSIDQLIFMTARPGQDRMPAEIRLAAALSLARLGNRNGAFIADDYWQELNPAIRSQAAFVYGATDDPGNLAKLDQLMDDPSGIVRVAAAAATLRLFDRPGATGRSASVDTIH